MNPTRIEDAPLAELLRAAVADARTLARVEVELASDELRAQGRAAVRSGVSLAVALVAASVTVALLAVALVLTLGGRAWVAAVVAAGFALAATGAAVVGYRAMPSDLLGETRARVREDAGHLRERAT
jgi:uncharacterized membrane protein YqjE